MRKLEYGLLSVIDEGAVRWKVGTVEKYCSVVAARAYIRRSGLRQITLDDGKFLIDKILEACDSMKEWGVPRLHQLALQFHFKTCETLVWYAGENNLSAAELLTCAEFAEKSYREDVLERYRSSRRG